MVGYVNLNYIDWRQSEMTLNFQQESGKIQIPEFQWGFGKGYSKKHTTIDAGLVNLSTEEVSIFWDISAIGRASALHAGGYRFKSDMFHHKPGLYSIGG